MSGNKQQVPVSQPVAVPEALELEVFSNSHDEGYVNGWNACRAELLAAAQVQPAVAVPDERAEFEFAYAQKWQSSSSNAAQYSIAYPLAEELHRCKNTSGGGHAVRQQD